MDSELLDRLTQVFRIRFNMPELILKDELTAPDVPGWDSLNHITLILDIESEFGIRFSNQEVSELKNVGDLKRLVASKVK